MDAARPRLSPPGDRFLGIFSSPSPSPSFPTSPSAGDELLEGDLLFPAASSDPPPDASKNPGRVPHGHLGLLAALHDGDRKLLARDGGGGAAATATGATAGTLLRRKATIAAAAAAAASSTPSRSPQSAARAIPAAPRPRNPEQPPAAPYHQSAPVKVPVRPPPRRQGWDELAGRLGDDDDDEELFRGDAAMLPPHEMVARASAGGGGGGFGAPVNPSSMLEGAGRTLKGRDLRRVRDAVLRQTGFLD